MSAKEFWESITAPANEEVELERLDKERTMLWKTVDRLEAEKAELEEKLWTQQKVIEESRGQSDRYLAELTRLREALEDEEGMREARQEQAEDDVPMTIRRGPFEIYINIG